MKLTEWYDYKLTDGQKEFLESNIEVYDLNQFIKDQTEGLEESFWYKKVAIFVTPLGNGCYVDYEAKGETFQSVGEEVIIDTNEFDEEESKHVIYLRPTGSFTTKIVDIMQEAPRETVRAKDFFTKATYNDRCYDNFVELYDFLERMSFFNKKLDAGLDNKESGEVLTEAEKIKPETIYELSDDYVYTFVEDPVFHEAGDTELKVEDCEKEGWIQGDYIVLPKGLQFKFDGAVNNILSFKLPQLENKTIWFNDSDIDDFIKVLKEVKDLEEKLPDTVSGKGEWRIYINDEILRDGEHENIMKFESYDEALDWLGYLDYLQEIEPEEDEAFIYNESTKEKHIIDLSKLHKDLTEDIEKHDTLNPVLFDGEEIKPEIKKAIEKVVKEFVDELKEDEINFSLKDIILLGSNVSYNYTKDSDLDVHLIADSSTLECPPKLQDKLYGAYRSIFNRNYDINIKGIPLEIFVELDEPRATSNGIYSLNSGWLKKPEVRNIPDLDKEAFDKLFGEWEERYNKLIGKK